MADVAGRADEDNLTAEERGELARVRAEQLQQRGLELAAGRRATVKTVEEAHQRADSALSRAKSAHRGAATRHQEAGLAHRRAAAAHEEAALRAEDDDAAVHQSAAERHRDEADQHDLAAAGQFAAEDADGKRMR